MAGQDIIQSLEQIKLQVQEELRAVREYRALLNVRKAIEELSGLDDVTGPLEQVASQLQLRMKDMREYQALGSVEKSIGDVSQVLELLQDAAKKRAPAAPPAPASAPRDALAGVKFAPGLVGKPETGKPAVGVTVRPAAAPPAPPAGAPEFAPATPEAAVAAEPAPANTPVPPGLDNIEADIANVLRVGDRLRLKN